MNRKSSFQTAFTLMRWVTVVCFLAAPRVVGHRHVDVMDNEGASQVLASHLDLYHSSSQFPIDDRELHFHLIFSLLPAEIPPGASVESGLLLSGEVGQASQVELSGSHGRPQAIASFASNDAQIDAIVGESVHHSTNNFKRICLCVWII
jgi:hypothetical protein